MSRILHALFPTACMAALLFAPSQTIASSLELGIDRSALSAQSDDVQSRTLKGIHSLDATWFRDGPTSGSAKGVSNFVNLLRQAKQQNLHVLVNIVQIDSNYDNPEALPNWRIGTRTGWKEKALSNINLDKLAARLRALFGAIKEAGLDIDAVEFGNEDDTYAYDADVPNGHEPTQQELHTWLRGYGEFLKTGAATLHSYFPAAKIITFGIAHGSNLWDSPPHHIENPAHALAMLRSVDGFNYFDNAFYHVDGYGTHIYASNDINGVVSRTLHEDAASLGQDRPLWVTEWGFLDAKAFPNKTGQTIPMAIEEFLGTLNGLNQAIRLGPIMFYSYNGWLSDSGGNLSSVADVFPRWLSRK